MKGKSRRPLSPFTAKEREQLVDLYDALTGVISEFGEDFFNAYHPRRTKGLFNELEGMVAKYAGEEFKARYGG